MIFLEVAKYEKQENIFQYCTRLLWDKYFIISTHIHAMAAKLIKQIYMKIKFLIEYISKKHFLFLNIQIDIDF